MTEAKKDKVERAPRVPKPRAVPTKQTALDTGIPFRAGDVQGFIYGGRYNDYHDGNRRLVGVKMAAEIDRPHHVNIPTADFSVPHPKDMRNGVLEAIDYIAKGNDLYAGCMGGLGRTGLFMGCMAKVLIDFHQGEYMGATDPVLFVREHYKPHAIETQDQQKLVRGFDTVEAVHRLDGYQLSNVELFKRIAEDARREVQHLMENPKVRYVDKVIYCDRERSPRSALNRLLMFWKPD